MSNVYMGTDVEEFIFGEGTTYEEACKKEGKEEPEQVEKSVITDEEINEFGVIECAEDPEVACMRIALENEQNYNAIMNAMMTREYSVLESTGSEIVYEAANVKQFFELVKKQINKFWAKIQGVFKKLMDIIVSNTASNKAFIKKYGNSTFHKPETGKEFKGYEFGSLGVVDYDGIAGLVAKHVHVSDVAAADEEKATKFVTDFNAKFEDIKSEMRGLACGESKVAAGEFDSTLRVKLYGSKEKVVIKPKEFKSLIAELGSAMNSKKLAKESYNAAQKAVKILRGDVKHAESNLAKTEGRKNHGMKIAKCLTDAINASLTIMSKAFSVQTGAIVADMRQTRAMAAYYVTHQPKVAKEAAEGVDELGVVLI